MLSFIIRRIMILIPLLLVLSVISFVIIQLPPGNFVDSYVHRLQYRGYVVSEEEIAALYISYGLDKPVYVQYLIWMRKILLHGDFGLSLEYGNRPVNELIGERLTLTIVISLLSTIFVFAVSIPIGIYSATHQYSPFDYAFTFVGFIGLATPNFLFALIVMWFTFIYFDFSVVGLFSSQFVAAPWSLAKLLDMFKHMWAPMIIIGTAGTAGLIRVLRGCLLDELKKQYVITARAKGVSEAKLLFRYPVRVAINPIISTIGWMLPALISGEVLTAIVLDLPTTGPLLLQALLNQDMFLAGSMVMILSAFTVIGTLLSDILLVWVDPRIRYEGVSEK